MAVLASLLVIVTSYYPHHAKLQTLSNLEICTKVNSKLYREKKLYEAEANIEAYSKAKACTEIPTGTIQGQTKEWT